MNDRIMKKSISFRMWLSVLFGGIWQFICNIFSWKNKTPFWRVIWAAITVCVVSVTVMLAVAWYDEFVRNGYRYSANYYDGYISPKYKFHNNGRGEASSYIYDAKTRKKVMKGLDWIAVPESEDSLMVVSKDGKRGYVNRFTLETVVPFKYDAAWSFYEDVAAVCEGDSIHYIDHSGKPINNIKFLRDKRYDNYAYHGNYAAIPVRKKYGLIDKSGEWVVEPTYDNIRIGAKNLWYVTNDEKTGVIGLDGQLMLPIEYEYVWIHGIDGITVASAEDHSQSRYDYDGTLLDDFVFDKVEEMTYYINEFDDEGNQKQAVDNMLRYSANNFYGLMTRDGVPVIPPLYSYISCVKPGVYQCRISDYFTDCVMVNSKGDKIND